MTALPTPKRPAIDPIRRAKVVAGVLIFLAALAAYHNSLSVPFLFDDRESIVENATLRSLLPIGRVLSPPASLGQTVAGRPMLNLSLAVNDAISGMRPWSYHAANLLIHALAGLTLFGIVHRTIEKRGTGLSGHPILPAFAAALLWVVHPLQTESVTYVVQRAESLMGLFYLLTLYCFIRGIDASATTRRRHLWFGLSWLACLSGMATKEVMVSVPVIVLLYDRTFRGGSLREAWKARRGYYLALGSTWFLLAWLVIGAGGNRGGTSGFGLGVSWGRYLLTQGPAILHYLRLAVWPHPLVFYYTARWVHGASAWAECGVVVLLLAATGFGLWRSTEAGFLGAWFFAILAPTSLVPGPAVTLAEHRMYLPLAAVLVLGVAAAYRITPNAGGRWVLSGVFLGASIALCILTVGRNAVYKSGLTLWADTVKQCPDNPYAQNNLGVELTDAGRLSDAFECLTRAIRLRPAFADAYNNLGNVLRKEGRAGEAAASFESALRIRPDDAEAYNNLGNILREQGRSAEAVADFERALRIKPDYAEACNGLGTALTDSHRLAEAIAAFEQALRIKPDYAQAQYNLGFALAEAGRLPEAVARYEEAIRLAPDLVEARLNLGNAFILAGRYREAAAQYEAALGFRPDYAPARENLARLKALEWPGNSQP